MLSGKSITRCFSKAFIDTIDHDGIEHAGYIAFLSILSIFPFLVFIFSIVGFLGQTEIGFSFINSIIDNDIIPYTVMHALEPRIQEIFNGPPQGLLNFAIIGAIWTASSMVEGLRTILNRAYRVRTPPAYIFRRLLSIGQFLILTVAIIFVTFIFIITPNIFIKIRELFPEHDWKAFIDLFIRGGEYVNIKYLWYYLRYVFVAFVILVSVAIVYTILPNIENKLMNVLPGATIVVALWFILGGLFSVYVSHFNQVHIIYGSLGGIIGTLFFFYICAMVFMFGAEFNYHINLELNYKILEKQDI